MQDLNITYRINKKAKRISIRLEDTGLVIVNVPRKSQMRLAENFVLKNSDWISKKISSIKSRFNIPDQFNLQIVSGESIILFDDSVYTLQLLRANKNYYKLNEDLEQISLYVDNNLLEENDINKAYLKVLKKFYIDLARKIFEERSLYFASKLGVTFNKIAIKDQSTRWGSCSSAKNLNYNFRVLLAPERVLDYLVVHEVCHLVEMNHSSQFWKLVESLMPDYQDSKKWLSDNGFLLKYYLK